LKACLHAKHPPLKPLTRKGEGSKAKRDAKDLDAIRVATKFNKGDKPMKSIRRYLG
jgi:hypothetical protein